MAQNFDIARLSKHQYRLNTIAGAIRHQNTAIEFMNIVRTDSATFRNHKNHIKAFVKWLDDDAAWILASNVVPELRYNQTFDTSTKTPLNHILYSLRHRRPPPPAADSTNTEEKLLVKQRLRMAIEYIETEGRGIQQASQDERDRTDQLTARVLPIIDPTQAVDD